MHAPNAPLAQLRSPLRRADSMANRSVGFQNADSAAANPFPPRKRTSAPLKALLRGDENRAFDRENSYPTRDAGAVGHENSNTRTNARIEGRPSAATRAPPPTIRTTRLRDAAASDGGPSPFSNDADSQPDSPAFVAAVPGDLKRKAAKEPVPEPLSSESFSFFGDETTKPASSEDADGASSHTNPPGLNAHTSSGFEAGGAAGFVHWPQPISCVGVSRSISNARR